MIDVLVTFFLLASAISANKVLLYTIAPTFFVGLRMLLAGLISVGWQEWSGWHVTWRKVRRDIQQLTLVSVFTSFLPSILKAYGLKYMLSSKMTLLGSIDPFVAALYDYVFFSHPLTFNKLLGIIIGFVGVVILLFGNAPQEQSMEVIGRISKPEIAILVGVFILRYGWYLMQRLVRSDRYTPIQANGITMMISGILALGLSWFVDAYWIKESANVCTDSWLFFYTVVMGNVLGYGFYAHLLKRYNATYISLFGFSIPVFVTILGWLFLDEPITYTFVGAGLIIFVGMYIFYRQEISAKNLY